MSYCINPKCQKRQNPDKLERCQACGSSLIINERYRLVRPLRELDGRHPTEIFEVDNWGTPKVLKVLTSNRRRLVELFQREAQVLQRLRHSGIPRIDTSFIFAPSNGPKELHCLVMEKISGQNLAQWLEENGPIPEALAIDWLRQLANILGQVHREQLLHRDIKPSNIMLRPDGQLVLIDFGTVREVTRTYIEKLGGHDVTRVYSQGYTAPEQVNGKAVPESEFFALGRTFVHLLTGTYPDDLPKDLQTNQLIWRDSAPQVSASLADLMDELMAPLPQNRPRNSQVILARLVAAKFSNAAKVSVIDQNPAEVPQTLINNRYQIQRVLGQGGFGRTYLASDDQRFGELCVLKEFVPSSRVEYTVQKLRALFETEAKVLYQINHPQIPQFLACFEYMGRLFIVQEYIDGKTYAKLLRERRQQGQLFSEAEVIQWLRDLLPVLTYLHDRNMVHRDISPNNVMLPNGQSRPMLIDFGLVKQTVTQTWAFKPNSSSGSGQSFVGKFGYVPPEQMRMGQCYPCSDLYALGVTAVVLLTGIEPYLLIDRGTLEWQWHSYVKVSNQLGRILDKMLTEKPKDRYQSAQEVLAELQHFALTEVIAVPTPPMELHIEIDQARLDRQLAETAEMDSFQQLQRQAEELRNSVEDPDPQLEAEVPRTSTLLGEKVGNCPSGAVSPEIQPESATSPKLNPEFINCCQQELARLIGPIARYILEETLTEHPDISPAQLVEALAAEIPNPQQAQEFRNIVEITPAPQPETGTPQQSVSPSPETVVVAPKIQPEAATPPKLNPAFIDRCRQELARRMGPIARHVLEETLAEHPDISPVQLVEALAAEIRNPQQSVEFRQNLLL